jgi:two-component system response regulator (stage 0 sporulation protein F)
MIIYLAEDDQPLRSTLALLLHRDGHRVIEANSGLDLLRELCRPGAPGPACPEGSLVVTDMRMPRIDGLDVMRWLRSRGGCPEFVLMTAFANAELRLEARKLGALAVFDKPFDLDELRSLIRQRALANAAGAQV